MSLNYELGKIKDFKDVCYEAEKKDGTADMKPTCHTLIFLMMAIGINEITEANAQQVFNRISLLERNSKGGAFRKRDRLDVYFTLDEVETYIGLYTNAGRSTLAEFLKQNRIKL